MHWELIFFLLNTQKCYLSDVETAVFQGLQCLFEIIFGLNTIPKFELVEIEQSMFQGVTWSLQLIFGLWTSLNKTWVKS